MTRATLHASAVALEGRGLLILGGAGAGKSTLALEMIALGARLIADDVVFARVDAGRILLSAPGAAAGRIEARGIGLLRLPQAPETELSLVIDLDSATEERLPPARRWRLADAAAPLLHRPVPLIPAALRAALLSGGPDDPETPVATATLATSTMRREAADPRGESDRRGHRGVC